MTAKDTTPTAPPTAAAPVERVVRLDRGGAGQVRARETRRAVLLAAAGQFDAAGYQAASMNAIARHARVTKGALYFHFPTKHALAEAVIAERNTSWTAMVADITAGGLDPLRKILAITDAAVVYLSSDPIVRGGNRLLNDPALRGEWIAEIAAEQFNAAQAALLANLTDAAHTGLLRPCINHEDLARLARGVMATLLGHHLICELTHTDNGPTVLVELWDRLTEMWLDLLPLITTQGWLERWDHDDWPHRPPPLILESSRS